MPKDENKRPKLHQEWTDEEIAMLGTDTDQAVADMLGRPRNSVKNKRIYMKIPTKSRFRRWERWERETLGKYTDAAVAEMLGRPLIQVTAQRQRLKIPAVLDARNRHGPRKHAIPEHILERLGKTSDVELAKEAGVTWHTIRARRLERGIPAFQP